MHPACVLVLVALTSLVLTVGRVLYSIRSNRSGKACNPPSLAQLDPIFGLDIVLSSYRKLRCHEFLSLCQQRFAQVGNTYSARIPGSKIIVTCEPENVKALLATQHQDFCLGKRRKQAFHPLLGDSIFASDGQLWKEARQQLRPSFAKDRLSEAGIFETYADALIEAINAHQTVQEFAEKYVKIAVDTRHHQKSDDIERYHSSILEELARQSSDINQLRDQALSLLIAGRDTTASLLSSFWFVLSHRPEIWDQLQAEIEFLDGRSPRIDELKDLKYLQACMRECKRLSR